MRTAHLLISVLVGTFALGAQQEHPPVSRPVFENPPALEDRYSISVVSAALQFLKRGGNSIEAKGHIWPLLKLGDSVSIATLKIYSTDELLQTENTQAYLTAVRNAFSSRSSVLEKSDTNPRVTLLVLSYLRGKVVSNPGIGKRIAYLEGCVKDFTCSSQGEYDFFHKPPINAAPEK
jgi:hypothetical protein